MLVNKKSLQVEVLELTACELEVALVVVQGVEAELHCLAHYRDVAPAEGEWRC